MELSTIVAGLMADKHVEEVLIGGSQARGTADAVSDLDLWVRAEDWCPTQLGSVLLAGRIFPFGPAKLFHGVTTDGLILDVMVGPKPFDGYQPVSAVSPKDLSGLMPLADTASDFWINSYKHRKPLYRDLDGMVCFGLHHDRMLLLRLWVIADLGEDPGDSAFTISGLTPLIKDHLHGRRRELFGLPARNRGELLVAIDAYREEALAAAPESKTFADLVMNDPVYRGLRP